MADLACDRGWRKYDFDDEGLAMTDEVYDELRAAIQGGYLENLHLGVTVENQAAANERIPWLLKTPAAKRFLSVEPLLEQTFLDFIDDPTWRTNPDWHPGLPMGAMLGLKGISQVIIGGESGSNARPFHLEWARSMLHDCRHAGVSFFMKQMGSNPFIDGKPIKLKSRSGTDISEWPQDLQVQEFI
jgi:protein gp37